MRFPGDRRRHPKGQRWPDVMAAALGAAWDVVVEGHPGRTTVFDDPIEGAHKNASRALHILLESHRPVDHVLIMLGTNDLKARFGVQASDVALGVQRLATEISKSDCGPDGRAPSITLISPVEVLETGVFREIFAGAQKKSRDLPAQLQAVADRMDAGFVDASIVASVDPVDGIHLDAKAHAAIGAHVADAIAALNI